ncbi:MAG: DUF2207 domain-containing protein [gamma proteobacterium symbiont of Phacoides pectinatus]
MGYDKKAFSAALVNMAVKGYLGIRESDDGQFTLEKSGAPPPTGGRRGGHRQRPVRRRHPAHRAAPGEP